MSACCVSNRELPTPAPTDPMRSFVTNTMLYIIQKLLNKYMNAHVTQPHHVTSMKFLFFAPCFSSSNKIPIYIKYFIHLYSKGSCNKICHSVRIHKSQHQQQQNVVQITLYYTKLQTTFMWPPKSTLRYTRPNIIRRFSLLP